MKQVMREKEKHAQTMAVKVPEITINGNMDIDSADGDYGTIMTPKSAFAHSAKADTVAGKYDRSSMDHNENINSGDYRMRSDSFNNAKQLKNQQLEAKRGLADSGRRILATANP